MGLTEAVRHRRHSHAYASRMPAKLRLAQMEDSCARMACQFDAGTGVPLDILSIGDCHGGRTLRLLSSAVESHFFGGSIYSWVSGQRELPPLRGLLRRRSGPRVVVAVFSYGEIDCRCHNAKWADDVEGQLAAPYVDKVRQYVSESCSRRLRVLPIVLAVPPATDEGDVAAAPLAGKKARAAPTHPGAPPEQLGRRAVASAARLTPPQS